jgi:pyruvate dehydrogenase complex dehydrogenase (E1) component
VEFAVGFFKLCQPSQPHSGGALGFFGRHASPDIFLREHFEMGLKLMLEVLLHVAGRKPRASSGSERSYPGKHFVILAP